MIRLHIWPRGLMGRVMLVLLAAILLEFLGSALLYQYFDRSSARRERAQHLAEQLAVADRLLSGAPIAERPGIATQLSAEHIQVVWRKTPIVDQTRRDVALRELRHAMVSWERSLSGRQIRLAKDVSGKAVVHGTIGLRDGSFLHFSARVLTRWETFYSSLLSIGILLLGVMLAAAMVIRVLGRPLRSLASAVDAAGHGAPVMLTERGPRDLRLLARAFNAMQLRIGDLIDSRTRALAAVSHDLRTPLARLRLRSEQIDEDFVRAAISKDINEMERMLESVLTYLSGEANAEQPRLTDLASLAMTVVDDAADTGRPVSYDGPDVLHAMIRPLRVKRALDNLIDNAVNYGDRAYVSLRTSGRGMHLVVEDDGPGIPPGERARAMEPFQRLDTARPRDTDGLGLGLSIVSHTMQQEGGELRIGNRSPHGLKAELFFPQDSANPHNNLK